jgi:hypothetical protein
LAVANACHLVIGASLGSCARQQCQKGGKEGRGERTYGLLTGEASRDGREVSDDTFLDDPSRLGPNLVDEELDTIAGVGEENLFLVGSVQITISMEERKAEGEETNW